MSELTDEQREILSLIERDEDLANYFFARIKSLFWFDPLDKLGYFSPHSINYDAQGNAILWKPLGYLERLTATSPHEVDIAKKVIPIVRSLIQYSANEKPINNVQIWWYVIKILTNIPTNVMFQEITLEEFRLWLSTIRAGSKLVLPDITGILLPKLLKVNMAKPYVEVCINEITKVVSMEKYSNSQKDLIVPDSFWILDAFQKNGKEITEKLDAAFISKMAERLRTILEYKTKDQAYVTHIGNETYRITISRIPSDTSDDTNGFISEKMKCIVQQYSSNQSEGVDEENLWQLHDVKPDGPVLLEFEVPSTSKDVFVKGTVSGLPSSVRWELDKKIEANISSIFKEFVRDYSYIYFKSLPGTHRSYSNNAEEVLTILLVDLVSAKTEGERLQGKAILENLLTNRFPFPIFKRLVLFCANKYWDDYSDLFYRFLDVVPDAFEIQDYEVELFDLLSNHNAEFGEQLERIIFLIEKVPEGYATVPRYPAYWKHKWYSPLRNNPTFKALYEDNLKLIEPEDRKPYEPDRSYEWTIVKHISPIDVKDILDKPISEFVKYSREFQGSLNWRGNRDNKPDKLGLAETFQMAVRNNPKKFTDEINSLYEIEYVFLTRFYRGLLDAWNSKIDLAWDKIFDFSISYLSADPALLFKKIHENQEKESSTVKDLWVISNIVDLIAEGSKNKDRHFDLCFKERVEHIFELIVAVLDQISLIDDLPKLGHALMYALNSTLGKTILSYIYFSRAVFMIKKEDIVEMCWNKKYEKFFPLGIDAYIWFGGYLPLIWFFDNKYAKGKIEDFAERKADDHQWQMFMEGYLQSAEVNLHIYPLMRPHYLKALVAGVFADPTRQRLVEHITCGFLHFGEELKEQNENGSESLIWKILLGDNTPNKKDHWIKIANFFWSITMAGENKDQKINPKIVEFWRWSFDLRERVKSTIGDEYDSFLGKMASLTGVLDTIDEEKEKWLLLSVPYVDNDFNSPYILKAFLKFDGSDNVSRVANIFLNILNHSTPIYDTKDIINLVEKIYKTKPDAANEICNTYSRRGQIFLTDIWEKHNPT